MQTVRSEGAIFIVFYALHDTKNTCWPVQFFTLSVATYRHVLDDLKLFFEVCVSVRLIQHKKFLEQVENVSPNQDFLLLHIPTYKGARIPFILVIYLIQL